MSASARQSAVDKTFSRKMPKPIVFCGFVNFADFAKQGDYTVPSFKRFWQYILMFSSKYSLRLSLHRCSELFIFLERTSQILWIISRLYYCIYNRIHKVGSEGNESLRRLNNLFLGGDKMGELSLWQTDQPTDQQTDRRGHREVTLPLRFNFRYVL